MSAIVGFALLFCGSAFVDCPTLRLDDAIRAAEAINCAILTAQLDKKKATEELFVAHTHRLPVFSFTVLGSQPFSHLGLTLEKGSLGVYPTVGPIPGRTTTLQNPLGPAGIFFTNIAEPLTQHYKIGLGIQFAHVGENTADEQVRLQRQSVANEVRNLYYGILQTESGRRSLQATVDFLRQLDHDTGQDRLQRVALQSDALRVKAQLAQAEYDLLKLDDPLETQKQELNRLIGRDVNTAFEVDPLSATNSELPDLKDRADPVQRQRKNCPGALFHLRARHENYPVGGVCRKGKWAYGGGCPSSRDDGISTCMVIQEEY